MGRGRASLRVVAGLAALAVAGLTACSHEAPGGPAPSGGSGGGGGGATDKVIGVSVADQKSLFYVAEVQGIKNELYARHRESVVFDQDPAPRRAPGGGEEGEAALIVQPLVGATAAGTALSADRYLLALVRGVLYGLRQQDGEVVWAMRVGIDTTRLPVRVPRTPNAPELALVLSADTLALTAVNVVTGETLWRHALAISRRGRRPFRHRQGPRPALRSPAAPSGKRLSCPERSRKSACIGARAAARAY